MVLVFLAVFLPLTTAAQTLPFASAAVGGASSAVPDDRSPGNPAADLSASIPDLMQKAQKRYLEGSNLIKSGESSKARAEFNKAIEAKQVAQQEAEKQKYVLQQAELQKQTEVARAKGTAEAARLNAEALKVNGGGLVIARE